MSSENQREKVNDKVSQVDFEISLCALLSVLVLNYSIHSGLYIYIEIFGLGILAVTLIRRMALINEVPSDSRFFLLSTYSLLFLMITLSMYVFFVISVYISGSIIVLGIGFKEIFWVFTPAVTLLIATTQQLTIGGFLEEGSNIFDKNYEKQKSPLIRSFSKKMSIFSADASGSHEHIQTRTSRYVNNEIDVDDLSEEEFEQLLEVGYNVLGEVVGILAAVLLYLVLIFSASLYYQVTFLDAFFTFISMFIVYGLLNIWLSRYGLLNLNQVNGLKKFVFTTVPGYVLLCHLIYTF